MVFWKMKLAFVDHPGSIQNHSQVSFSQLLLIFWGSEGDLSIFEKIEILMMVDDDDGWTILSFLDDFL